MATTTNHALPYPVASDAATPHLHLKALAEKLDTELNAIAPGQISGVSAGKLLIANASGVVTGTTMTGDVTVSNAGVSAIGAGKVGSSQLASNAVTSAKIDSGAVTNTKIGVQAVTNDRIKSGDGVKTSNISSWFKVATRTGIMGNYNEYQVTWPSSFSGDYVVLISFQTTNVASNRPIHVTEKYSGSIYVYVGGSSTVNGTIHALGIGI